MGLNLPVAPSNGEVWEFVVRGRDAGVTTAIINRIRMRVEPVNQANPINIDTIFAALGAFRTRWRTGIRSQLCNGYLVDTYSLQRIIAVDVVPGSSHANVHYDQRRDLTGVDPDDRGALALAPEPNFVAARIYWGTVLISANTRTMMRVSPIPDANVDGANLTVPYRAALQAAADLLWPVYTDAANNCKWIPCVFSAQTVAAIQPPPLPTLYANYVSDFISADVGYPVGSQLTRKNRGTN